jgi:hypothetical protein
MATSININDRPREITEEDEWREEITQIETICEKLKLKHRKMAAKMVSYVCDKLASVPGIEVVPIFVSSCLECRVKLRGNQMYRIYIDPYTSVDPYPSNSCYIALSSLNTQAEAKTFFDTPQSLVETLNLINTNSS